jgi:hypothetical protein
MGNPPQRPDQLLQPRSRAGVGPAPSNVGIFNRVILTGPSAEILGTDWILNAQGYFQYNGTPALGNLIQSFAPQPGTDQFGNAYAGSTPITQFITANGQTFVSNETYWIRSGSGGTAGTWTVVGSNFEHSNSSTFSLTPANVGDLILVAVMQQSNATVTATALSSSNVTWTLLGSAQSSHIARTGAIFAGQVTAASAATVTVTWSGGAPAVIRIAGQEFTSSAGAGAWALDGAVAVLDPAANVSSWPVLTPALTGELYWGYNITGAAPVAGSTSGFTYIDDASGNSMAYNPSVSAATGPVFGNASQRFGLMLLMQAGTGGSGNFTGLIMAKGTWDGQPCQIWDTSSGGSLTFNANPAISNVADAALGDVISPLSGAGYVWSTADQLWYPL